MRPASVCLAALINLAMLATAQAQVPNGYSDGPGRSINGDIRAAVQAQWEQLPTAEIVCIDRGLRRRGGSINTAIGQGISPADSRIARFRRDCQSAVPGQPQDQAQGQVADTRTGPSFDCRRASNDDEIAICASPELSRLDRAIGDGFNYLRSRYGNRAARRVTDPMLRQRGDCEDDVACIKRVQQMTISLLQSRGAPIQAEPPAPPSSAPAAVDTPNTPPSAAPQPAPPSGSAPQASQPAPAPPMPAAVPAPAATPPAATPPAVPAPAAAPETPPAKPAAAPSPPVIRDVAPGITAAPSVVTPPVVTTAPAKTESSSLVFWLMTIIVVLFGVIGLLLLRLNRARPLEVAASAGDSRSHTSPAAAEAKPEPEQKPAEDAILRPVAPMPAAAASAAMSEPPMDLASLTPSEKPVDEPAAAKAPDAVAATPETPATPADKPLDPATAATTRETPATTATAPADKPIDPPPASAVPETAVATVTAPADKSVTP
ncbi:MAG: hypothetical protein ABW213_09070 [Tardiphaga sp.]